MQHQTLYQMLLSNDRNKNISHMTEHSVCSMECSDPTSFSYLCQGLGKTCLYTLKFLIKSIIPVMPLCLFFKPPWMQKILLLHMLTGSSVNRDTDHNFKPIFIGMKMSLTLSVILKWMTLPVFSDCY